jgi:hypothetical protein
MARPIKRDLFPSDPSLQKCGKRRDMFISGFSSDGPNKKNSIYILNMNKNLKQRSGSYLRNKA